MNTRIDEIAPNIHRVSTFIPDIGPVGFTFNQFLLVAEQPLLYHTGPRAMFPLVSEALASVIAVETLRWIAFSHVESDESGSMNQFLAAAPNATVCHGAIGCMTSLNDLCDRPPRALADGEVLDLGGLRVRHIDTPHVPHGWESRVLYEEATGTLFCGDILTHVGPCDPVTQADILSAALGAEDAFGATTLSPQTTSTLRRLADLEPRLLAIMHGASYAGDGGAMLRRAADAYDARMAETFGVHQAGG